MRRCVVAVVLILGAFTAACEADTATPTPSPSVSGRPSGAAAGCPVPSTAPVDLGSVLIPGPTNGLPTTDAKGEPLVIVAAVLGPDCRPAAGTTVNVWHTDARGLYRPEGTDACCYYQGLTLADGNGRFRLETIRPAQYPEPGAPPAHIHLELRHGSGRLFTEIVFTTDPTPVTTARASRSVPVFLTQRDNTFYGEVTFVLERL
jgi:protocatechuate 3,4-dioxygenase beta subunit